MARRAYGPPAREQKRTALMVGEGLAEQVFLNHLKALYVVRGHKQVTVKNAKGKGGAKVLDYTRRQCQVADYDCRLALLDTDTDWDDTQRRNARAWGIEVVEASPCLEPLLLRIAGIKLPQRARHPKSVFLKRFGSPAHAPDVYERHFPQSLLEGARTRVPELDQLIRFLQQ